MGRTGLRLALGLVAITVLLGGVALLKGGFYIGKHEGDTLHLLQMVFRMAQGDVPHIDFVTPIGLLAMAPIAVLVGAGLGAGHAILWSQVLVAVVALPAIWWVAISRFRGILSWAFGALILVMILALVHGEAERSVSISMHYNRWAWAAAFLAVATALLPTDRDNRIADGLVIGGAMAVLIMTKMTYFAAFLIPVLVALIGRKSWGTIGIALAFGLVLMAGVTIWAGTPLFWIAYLRDLFTVMASDVRPQPGLPFSAVVGAPAYMAGSLGLILSVIWLRQAERKLEGLVMLLLVPAFFYVTYQNFGNDPQWLPLVGLILIALRPDPEVRNGLGWNMDRAMTYTAIAIFAFGAPSVINLAYSPFRHLAGNVEEFVPLLPGQPAHDDLRTAAIRAHRVDGRVALDGPDSPYAAFWEDDMREGQTITWQGEELPVCTIELGTVAMFTSIADALNDTGLIEGKTAFVADLLNSYWLYGAFEPLQGNAPWYYGRLTGFKDADYLVVPLCPLSIEVRKQILDQIQGVEAREDEDGNEIPAIEGAGVPLTEVARDELFILYEIGN